MQKLQWITLLYVTGKALARNVFGLCERLSPGAQKTRAVNLFQAGPQHTGFST